VDAKDPLAMVMAIGKNAAAAIVRDIKSSFLHKKSHG